MKVKVKVRLKCRSLSFNLTLAFVTNEDVHSGSNNFEKSYFIKLSFVFGKAFLALLWKRILSVYDSGGSHQSKILPLFTISIIRVKTEIVLVHVTSNAPFYSKWGSFC